MEASLGMRKWLLFPFWKVLQFLENEMKVEFLKIGYNIF
jgi:hypothetical protein